MIKKWWKTTQVYIWWKIVFPDKSFSTYEQDWSDRYKRETAEMEKDWNKLKEKLTNNTMEDSLTDNPSTNSGVDVRQLTPQPATSPATALEGIISTLDNHNANLTNTLNSYIATATKLAPLAFQAIQLVTKTPGTINGGAPATGILDKVNSYISQAESILADIATVDTFIKTQI